MSRSKEFFANLQNMLNARYPVIYLETAEFDRVYRNLKGIAPQGNYSLFSWNRVDSLQKIDIIAEGTARTRVGDDLEDEEQVLQEINNRRDTPENEIFVLESFHDFMGNIRVKTWLRKFAEELKFTRAKKHIILLSPVRNLPPELEKAVTILELPLPDKSELKKTLNQVINDARTEIEPQLSDKLVEAALGMTELEADLAFCLAWSRTQLGKNALDVVISEKEQIIKKSGILEFFRQKEGLKDVGGLDYLKTWLEKRAMSFSPGARMFHLAEPKGILLLGIPGCGKSLTAKAIASLWNMPLLRFDIGKVFEGVVGSSEGNVRLAIKTAEAVAPCVLWIDEIEKGLAGTGSSGSTDSGVTSRVFSSLLTWMQEKQKPVFVVATANSIEHLPPELLRKGRFDGIFFVDLPTLEERAKIFEIHLGKRGQTIDESNRMLLARKTVGFNGAEIEEVVNEALFSAYSTNPESPKLELKHLVAAIEETVILAATMKERIQFLRDWADTRAMKAGKKNDEKLPQKETKLAPQEERRSRDLSGGLTDIPPSQN
ncbi:MAG: AAA family ATPase [Bacteroidia bacterium]|nr:AAA family ATPase [Bacteroidia bacterium]